MTAVGTTAITYDAIGNPTTYNGYSLTWDGRQLKKMEKTNSVIEFLYNADGIRTSKTVNGTEHVYTLNGSQIVSETRGDIHLIYLYDESGSPIGMMAVSCSSRKRGFVLLSSYPHYSVASRSFCSERPFVGFRVPILGMKGK